MKKQLIVLFSAVSLGFLVSGVAHAGGWTPWTNVSLIYTQSGGHVYLVVDPGYNHVNPDGCTAKSHLILDTNTNEAAEKIYKMALTAKAADLRVRVYVEGCTGVYPTVQHMMLAT